ncbi:MAG: hypothetical protein IH589_08475 [Anaerolineales bacterium]|nr:hypothetical protein [Anaerolineales bacterium]
MAKKNKRPTPVSNIPATQVEFNPDYSMIKRDLKRIGGLAGFFIVILVVLSFFLK